MSVKIIYVDNPQELLCKVKKYEKWEDDNEIDLLQEKTWVIQQSFGKCYFTNEMGFETLVPTDGSLQGFDGILSKNKKVFLYESKSSENHRISKLAWEARKTLEYPSTENAAQIKNMQKNIDSQNEIKILGEWLNVIKVKLSATGASKKKTILPIEDKRMLLCLGNALQEELITPKTEEKLSKKGGYVIIKFKKYNWL